LGRERFPPKEFGPLRSLGINSHVPKAIPYSNSSLIRGLWKGLIFPPLPKGLGHFIGILDERDQFLCKPLSHFKVKASYSSIPGLVKRVSHALSKTGALILFLPFFYSFFTFPFRNSFSSQP